MKGALVKRITHCLGLLLLWQTIPVYAEQFSPAQLRVPFLFHIAHFTQYPKQAINQQTLNFCFLEDQQYAHASIFKEAPPTSIHNLPVHLQQVESPEQLQQLNCQVLFVGENQESPQLFDTLSQLNADTISIGETQNFIEQGGMMAIIPLRSKMKIYLSKTEYEKTTLKFSSLLLKRVKFR